MKFAHVTAYLIAAAVLFSGCAARPGQTALSDAPESSETAPAGAESPAPAGEPGAEPGSGKEDPLSETAEESTTEFVSPADISSENSAASTAAETGWTENVTLDGADGTIHYSYYLPESYDGVRTYPLVVAMPGYDRMWFGEDSAGSNLTWNGVQAWTKLDTEVIVASAQLTDWGETSARQANELAQYMIDHFCVDTGRVYAAGYSAGGETMSRAVALRPDLYAAYVHGGSQWDGAYDTVAESRVAVYIFMAEHDEYYGSQKARDAYDALYDAYVDASFTEDEIDALLHLQIPDDTYFNERGIYNYHGGGSIVFDDTGVLNWILEQSK